MEEREQMYPPGRSRVLVVTAADVHEQQGAPPPAWELAETLSREYDVILTTPATGAASHPDFAVIYYNRRNLALLAGDSDLVLVEAPIVRDYDFFSGTGKLFNADWDSIISGNLSESALLPPGQRTPGDGERHFMAWAPPHEKRGLSYYLGRVRFHMRAGGLRRVLSRGMAAVLWKLGGRGR